MKRISAIGEYGHGSFSVLAGGKYTHIEDGQNHWMHFARQTGSTATLLVDGVVGTNRSTMHQQSSFFIGDNGTATAVISNGGLMISEWDSSVGSHGTGNGSLHIKGVDAASGFRSELRSVRDNFHVGADGQGTLEISDGGLLQVKTGFNLGWFGGGTGTATVHGVDATHGHRSTVIAEGSTRVARDSNWWMAASSIDFTNGALLQTGDLLVAVSGGTKGNATFSGVYTDPNRTFSSEFTATGAATIGAGGTGTLTLSDGAQGSVAGQLTIGDNVDSIGTVSVSGIHAGTGIATKLKVGSAHIGNQGTGELNLMDGAFFEAGSVLIASNTAGSGAINIGNGGVVGGFDVGSVTGVTTNALINFDHTNDLTLNGTFDGFMAINKMSEGHITLNGAHTFTGSTAVHGGGLYAGANNVFSPNSSYYFGIDTEMGLNGFQQSTGTLVTSGRVTFGGTGGTQLQINGDYYGSDALIEFNTVLGNDNSVTDKMLIAGDSNGTTNVIVNNRGGLGDVTSQGIPLIQVGGNSDGTFTLINEDYVNKAGAPVIVAGAYAYSLQRSDTNPNNKGWFLRSQIDENAPPAPQPGPDPVPGPTPDPTPNPNPTPNPDPQPGPQVPDDNDGPRIEYQAGGPVYEVYAQSLLGMTRVNTLQQRVGNRTWDGNKEGHGVWGRVEGAFDQLRSHKSTTDTDLSNEVNRLQLGLDLNAMERDSGRLVFGMFGQYAHGDTRTTSRDYFDGRIKSHGYGVGATLTWYGHNGWYADGQVQGTWYKSDMSTSTPNFQKMRQGNRGHGYGYSLEAGRRTASPWDGWTLVPQGQLTYKHIGYNSFTDAYNAHVRLDRGREMEGRLGLAAEQGTNWQAKNGQQNSSIFYGIANVYYDFMDNNRVRLATATLRNEQERAWGGIGMGGTLNWHNNRYSLSYEGLVNSSLSNFANSYSMQGNVTFRVSF